MKIPTYVNILFQSLKTLYFYPENKQKLEFYILTFKGILSEATLKTTM